MRRTSLLPLILTLATVPTTLWGDTMQCVTTRKGNDILDWSQLGPPGTPVPIFFTLVASGAFPLTVQGDSSAGSGPGEIGQEGNGYLGDFRVGDYLFLSLMPHSFDALSLQFTNNSGLPTGIVQAGAQIVPLELRAGQASITAYDKNLNQLGSCQINVTNNGKENNSAPYLGIEDLTSPNIYYILFAENDGFALNTVSLTTPGCGVPPNVGGASYKFNEVFASVGTDTSGNLGGSRTGSTNWVTDANTPGWQRCRGYHGDRVRRRWKSLHYQFRYRYYQQDQQSWRGYRYLCDPQERWPSRAGIHSGRGNPAESFGLETLRWRARKV